MQVHNLEKKLISKILAKLPPSPNNKILKNKMFIWIPNWSFLNPIIKSLYRILIFVNMVFQGKKYENAKLKKIYQNHLYFTWFYIYKLLNVWLLICYWLQILICIKRLVRDLKYTCITQFQDNAFRDYHKHIVCFSRE